MRYELQNETGRVIHESDYPTDLLGEPDEEAMAALALMMETGEALIGGGAAPLFVLVDTEFGLHDDDEDDGQPDEAQEWADFYRDC